MVQEISQKSAIEALLFQLSEKTKIKRQSMENIQPLVANWNLGDGESEAITLAMENSGTGVILDDLQATCNRLKFACDRFSRFNSKS